MKYRMYVDEVGNADLGASDHPNHRYLSLTGVILDLDHVKTTVFPRLEDLKGRYFDSHPDEPIIFHRKELVNRRPPFHTLRNREIEDRFNTELLALLQELEYVVIAATIDKLEHRQRYQVWKFDPYHYCLAVLLERFVLWLRRKDARGDVLAESRGGGEDRRLKSSFEGLYGAGTQFVDAAAFQACLTSSQLKVKPKNNNIAGLQLADMIAHPVYRGMLRQREGGSSAVTFGERIFEIVEREKLNRSPQGKIEGWGLKWLP